MRFERGRGQRCLPANAISVAITAFDESWTLIEGALAGRPQADIERVRDVLANAIANAALGGHTELSDLQQEGIRAVRVVFPSVGI